ncbi:hypothetical protein JW766_04800 [Candidatus Dojkabacteria bacterium]|nr:hypothetical protein [Candidatus Dojkabacteria bacterium]
MEIFDFKTYLYFWGSLFGCLLSLLIYVKRKDLRKEMLINGILFSVVGVIIEYMFFKDYWNPPLIIKFGEFGGLEDLMFGFAAGSFGSVFYTVLFKERLIRSENQRYWIIPTVLISQSLSFLVFTHWFNINSIYASSIGWALPTIVIIIIRKDLIKEVIISAILGGLILIIGEAVFLVIFAHEYLEKYFRLIGEVPVLIDVFPITEFIWGMSFGALISPLYEFLTGKRLVKANG